MDNENEIIENYKKHLIEERNKELSDNADLIEKFIDFCSTKGIQLSKDNFDYIQTIGIIAKFPKLAELLNDNNQPDKENLVKVAILETDYDKKVFASGFYFADMYMLMAHPYFRRAHSENANFAPRFIDVFWSFDKPNIDKYISIDSDRVRINVDNSMYMELDTWYGAKFKETIKDIENGVVKLRPPVGLEPFDIEFFLGNTYSLDIKWSGKNGIKVFQAEEFKEHTSTIEKDGISYHPAKYLHAEFDTKNGFFRHFDGAIHFYTEEEYYQRRESDFNYNNKNSLQLKTLSQKLFKINGQLEINDWVELTSHFLTGNPLIFEYFEGNLPDKILETVEKLIKHRENNHGTQHMV